MNDKEYYTPNVSDLTKAERSLGILASYETVSRVNALIDNKQVFNKIGEAQAMAIFAMARKTAVETITSN